MGVEEPGGGNTCILGDILMWELIFRSLQYIKNSL